MVSFETTVRRLLPHCSLCIRGRTYYAKKGRSMPVLQLSIDTHFKWLVRDLPTCQPYYSLLPLILNIAFLLSMLSSVTLR